MRLLEAKMLCVSDNQLQSCFESSCLTGRITVVIHRRNVGHFIPRHLDYAGDVTDVVMTTSDVIVAQQRTLSSSSSATAW